MGLSVDQKLSVLRLLHPPVKSKAPKISHALKQLIHAKAPKHANGKNLVGDIADFSSTLSSNSFTEPNAKNTLWVLRIALFSMLLLGGYALIRSPNFLFLLSSLISSFRSSGSSLVLARQNLANLDFSCALPAVLATVVSRHTPVLTVNLMFGTFGMAGLAGSSMAAFSNTNEAPKFSVRKNLPLLVLNENQADWRFFPERALKPNPLNNVIECDAFIDPPGEGIRFTHPLSPLSISAIGESIRGEIHEMYTNPASEPNPGAFSFRFQRILLLLRPAERPIFLKRYIGDTLGIYNVSIEELPEDFSRGIYNRPLISTRGVSISISRDKKPLTKANTNIILIVVGMIGAGAIIGGIVHCAHKYYKKYLNKKAKQAKEKKEAPTAKATTSNIPPESNISIDKSQPLSTTTNPIPIKTFSTENLPEEPEGSVITLGKTPITWREQLGLLHQLHQLWLEGKRGILEIWICTVVFSLCSVLRKINIEECEARWRLDALVHQAKAFIRKSIEGGFKGNQKENLVNFLDNLFAELSKDIPLMKKLEIVDDETVRSIVEPLIRKSVFFRNLKLQNEKVKEKPEIGAENIDKRIQMVKKNINPIFQGLKYLRKYKGSDQYFCIAVISLFLGGSLEEIKSSGMQKAEIKQYFILIFKNIDTKTVGKFFDILYQALTVRGEWLHYDELPSELSQISELVNLLTADKYNSLMAEYDSLPDREPQAARALSRGRVASASASSPLPPASVLARSMERGIRTRSGQNLANPATMPRRRHQSTT